MNNMSKDDINNILNQKKPRRRSSNTSIINQYQQRRRSSIASTGSVNSVNSINSIASSSSFYKINGSKKKKSVKKIIKEKKQKLKRAAHLGPTGAFYDKNIYMPLYKAIGNKVPLCNYILAGETKTEPKLIQNESSLPRRPEGFVRIVMISDTHGKHKQLKIPHGDILIHGKNKIIFLLFKYYNIKN